MQLSKYQILTLFLSNIWIKQLEYFMLEGPLSINLNNLISFNQLVTSLILNYLRYNSKGIVQNLQALFFVLMIMVGVALILQALKVVLILLKKYAFHLLIILDLDL